MPFKVGSSGPGRETCKLKTMSHSSLPAPGFLDSLHKNSCNHSVNKDEIKVKCEKREGWSPGEHA